MSRITTPEQESAKTLYKNQYNYLSYLSNLSEAELAEEGSIAIAAGRAAGMAKNAGLDNIAEVIWNKYIPNVKNMPTLEEFWEGYSKNANNGNFAGFKTGAINEDDPQKRVAFPHPGTEFSNACGSYAYALAVAAKGDEALAGGERTSTAAWAKKALTAAGYVEKANNLESALISEKNLEIAVTRPR